MKLYYSHVPSSLFYFVVLFLSELQLAGRET